MSADISISITLCTITPVTLFLSEGFKGSCFSRFERDTTCQLEKQESERTKDAVQEMNHRGGTSLSVSPPFLRVWNVCHGLTGSRLLGILPPFSISVSYQKSKTNKQKRGKFEKQLFTLFFCVGVARLIDSLFHFSLAFFLILFWSFLYTYDLIYRSEGEAVVNCECCDFKVGNAAAVKQPYMNKQSSVQETFDFNAGDSFCWR